MGVKLIYECDLCGKQIEQFPNVAQHPEAAKPAGWSFANRQADSWTGEEKGTHWYCNEQCVRGYLAAHEAALKIAKAKAIGVSRASFQAEMKRAKLVSRNAVDALAGLAGELAEP